MGFKIISLRVLAAIVFICAALMNTAQGQDHLLNRFKLTLNGGVNFADPTPSTGFPILQSKLSRLTEHTITFGSGLQFEVIPAIALEAGYKYADIRGEAGVFETNIHTASLKSLINFHGIFPPVKVLSFINPYLSGGVGYDFYSYIDPSAPSNSFDGESISYNAGIGLAVKATKNVDLFSHYEYHFATNTVDADDQNTGFVNTDLLTTLTAGIRIRLNPPKRRASRSSVQPPPVEPFPSVEPTSSNEPASAEEPSPEEYEDFDSVTRKIQLLEDDVNQLEQRMDEHERRSMEGSGGSNSNLVRRVENMEVLLQEVRSKLDDIPDEPVVENNSGIAQSIPRGTYVQIFASDKLSTAQKIRSDAISHLDNRLNDTSEQVFITRRDKFYQVLIGEFSDNEKAASIKKIMSDQHSDAFLIIFPRPMSLQSAYNDMQIVE